MFRRIICAVEAAALVAALMLAFASGVEVQTVGEALIAPPAEAWWDWLPKPHFQRANKQEDGSVSCESWGITCLWWD